MKPFQVCAKSSSRKKSLFAATWSGTFQQNWLPWKALVQQAPSEQVLGPSDLIAAWPRQRFPIDINLHNYRDILLG